MKNSEEQRNSQLQLFKINILSILNTLAISIVALCLAFLVFKVTPVVKWANYQNSCIEEISKSYPVAYSVRKCNGRSKIYMQK